MLAVVGVAGFAASGVMPVVAGFEGLGNYSFGERRVGVIAAIREAADIIQGTICINFNIKSNIYTIIYSYEVGSVGHSPSGLVKLPGSPL